MSPSWLTQNSSRQSHRICSLLIRHCIITPVSILTALRLFCVWLQLLLFLSSAHSPPTRPALLQDCVCWQKAETEGFVELVSSLLGYKILLSTTLKETPSQDTHSPAGHIQHFSPPVFRPPEQHWWLLQTRGHSPSASSSLSPARGAGWAHTTELCGAGWSTRLTSWVPGLHY